MEHIGDYQPKVGERFRIRDYDGSPNSRHNNCLVEIIKINGDELKYKWKGVFYTPITKLTDYFCSEELSFLPPGRRLEEWM